METFELKSVEKTPIVSQDYHGMDQNYNTRDKEKTKDDNEGWNNLSPQQLGYYRFCALLVAWISVIVLIILAVFSFGLTMASWEGGVKSYQHSWHGRWECNCCVETAASELTKSAAAFGFGFDCVLDIGTSAVVIWRFMGPVGSLYSKEKEKMALLALGVLFIVACCSILIRSILELIKAEVPQDSLWILIMAAVGSLICFVLAIAKFAIASKLNSRSIQSDGYSSLAGAITSLTWVISAFIIQKRKQLWFIDDIVGICVAILLFYYGACLLYQNIERSKTSKK